MVQLKQGWGTSLRKRENKWIRTGKNRDGDQRKEKRNKLISTGKTGYGGINLRKRENKWNSTGKNRGGGTNLQMD